MKFRPTVPFISAFSIMIPLLLSGTMNHKPQHVVAAIPLLIYVAWSLATRPQDQPNATIRPTPRLLTKEGEKLRLRAGFPVHASYITVQWTPFPGGTFHPKLGSIVDSPKPGEEPVVSLITDKWGQRELAGPVVCATSASFAWRAWKILPAQQISVLPLTEEMQAPSSVAAPIGISGVHLAKNVGDGSALAKVREFQPGDRLRRINWRVTSRTGTLHVAETHAEKDTSVLLIADTRSNVEDLENGGPTSLDVTVRALAAIGEFYLTQGDRVRLHDLGTMIGDVPPGTGIRHAQVLMQRLSRADAQQIIPPELAKLPHVAPGTLVFFCSPFLDATTAEQAISVYAMGAEVLCVDTFPEFVGTLDSLNRRNPLTSIPEALALQRLRRQTHLDAIATTGVPVTPWLGPASLGSVLLAMRSARNAPRLSRGRRL